MMKEICFYKLDDNAKIPTRNYQSDCGLDIYALEDTFIEHGTTTKVKTGVAVNILPGFIGKMENRSGVSLKGLDVGAGVIDPGYYGEACVVLHNLTNKQDHDVFGRAGYQVTKGDRIAQLLVYKVELPTPIEIHTLWDSERGNKGFSSSGK